MLVFAGLWGHCDKNGNFEWRPRTLKLDILPFLDFDMAETLGLLASNKRGDGSAFVLRYRGPDGREYGHIPTFSEHQRITGKEAEEPGRFPKHQQGNNGETSGQHQGRQEGKGKEGNRNGETSAASRLAGFPEFWGPWPKKVAKAAAERAWTKLAPDAALQARIHAAVAAQAASPDWQREGGRFIPHAATWLNGRRWEDQRAAPTAAGSDGVATLSSAEMAP